MHRSVFIFVASAAVMAGAAQADEPKKVAADWLKKPSNEDMLAFLPGEAMKQGVDGGATIECEVGTDGLLRKCVVLKEDPAGLGFGGAAIAVSPLFRMKPAMENGVPVPSTMRVPLKWKLNGGGSSGEKFSMVTRAVWAAAPTRADVEAERPKGWSGPARVLLNCEFAADGGLRRCTSQETIAAGPGATAAAVRVAAKFRSVVPAGGTEAFKDMRVLVPIQFDAPGGETTQDGRLLTKPRWAQRPNGEAIAFPPAARAAGLNEGRATVECAIAVNGALGDCQVTAESTAGVGFGDSALAAAALFKVNPWTDEGRPVDGARVRIGIRFADQAAPAEAAAPATSAPAAKP